MTCDRVGIAMIGAGFIADYHLAGLQAAGGADVRLVASRDAGKAGRLAQRYGCGSATGDWRHALDRPDVDAVVIATPDPTHEEIAVAAAAAGKAILLQKPMAGSVAACRRIIAAAQAAGVDLQVSFMHRYFEEVLWTRTGLADGVIGRLRSLRIRNATPGPDWGGWFFDSANVANGVIDQLGVHGIDLVMQLVGPIRDVSARVETLVPQRRLQDGRTVPVRVPDTALASYAFDDGLVGSHEMSMIESQGCDRFRLELYGEAGTMWLRTERGQLAVWAPSRYGPRWHVPDLPATPPGSRLHADWLAGVTGTAPRGHTAQEALAGMQVVEAIRRSAGQASARVVVDTGDSGDEDMAAAAEVPDA